jgi:Terminase large subunit, T4likevirus-type, N-terminal
VSELQVRLKILHEGQTDVLLRSERFNVLNIGRRWGKTTLAINELIIQPALDGFPVGYFAPTYSDLHDVWIEVRSILHDVISVKNEQQKQLRLITGGVIDFWGMDNPDSGRGRHYKRVVVDEAEKAKKFNEAWQGTILPTLLDLKGDAWILSTPKFGQTYFKQLFKHGRDNKPNWASFNLSTYSNPHIDRDELEMIRQTMDELSFRCEILAEDVDAVNNPFAYAFDEKKHVHSCSYNPSQEIALSFDFNVDPVTCIAAQDDGTTMRIIKEWAITNGDIYQLTDLIMASYPTALFLVTGDATGAARSAVTQGNINYYTVIQSKLGLGRGQMRQPRINPSIRDSRVLVNSILQNYPVIIDPSCEGLIRDLKYVQVDGDQNIIKDRKDESRKADLLDGFRYYLNTFKHDFVKFF